MGRRSVGESKAISWNRCSLQLVASLSSWSPPPKLGQFLCHLSSHSNQRGLIFIFISLVPTSEKEEKKPARIIGGVRFDESRPECMLKFVTFLRVHVRVRSLYAFIINSANSVAAFDGRCLQCSLSVNHYSSNDSFSP
jgi:hypothetical protein